MTHRIDYRILYQEAKRAGCSEEEIEGAICTLRPKAQLIDMIEPDPDPVRRA
eukprot:SAG31_NODE_3851_length_3817_cov_89.532544_5_plen_51_part_01